MRALSHSASSTICITRDETIWAGTWCEEELQVLAALQSLCAGMETVGSSELRVTPPPLSRPRPVSRLAGISHLSQNLNQPQQLV